MLLMSNVSKIYPGGSAALQDVNIHIEPGEFVFVVGPSGAGLGVWGVVNLLEGYGNDNPGAKSQGIKQLMAGAGIMLLGTTLIPQLATLFS